MGLLKQISRFGRKLWLAIGGFVTGLLCSLVFYEFVISETDFEDSYKVLMFLSSASFLSIGFAFSRQIRCITILTLPEFTTKSGRRSIQATIMILMLAGPVRNIGDNGEETLRFLGCIKDMLMEILIAGKDLVLAPIQHIIYEIKRTENSNSSFNSSALKELMNPIETEIEGEVETKELKQENDEIDRKLSSVKRSEEVESQYEASVTDQKKEKIEKSYKKKLAYRCEEVFSKGTSKCVELFQNKYDECSEAVTSALAWALCWPMKLHFICHILSQFSQNKICDMNDIVPSGFGDSYALAKQGIDDFSNSFRVKVNYEGLSQMINLDRLRGAKEDVLEVYMEGRKYVEWYLTLIKRGLALSYLLVLFGALDYHGKYFSSLSHDNMYTNGYFWRIDGRRRAADKSYLHPLRSFEKSNFSRLNRFNLTPHEWKKFGDHLFALLVQAALISTIFGFDFIFTQLLQLVQNHADMNIHQEGQHVLAIQVKGSGLLAQLLRFVIKDFSVNKKIDIKHFTQPCLPLPKVTPKGYYQRVVLLFSVLLINSYFEAHCIRFRHCIANYFYPKRSKLRTIWLYNETLKKRKSKMSHLKQRVLDNADKFRTRTMFVPQTTLVWMVRCIPKSCRRRVLVRLEKATRRCVVCTESGVVVTCSKCKFSYCKECFKDLNKRCLYCVAFSEVSFRIQKETHFDLDSNV